MCQCYTKVGTEVFAKSFSLTMNVISKIVLVSVTMWALSQNGSFGQSVCYSSTPDCVRCAILCTLAGLPVGVTPGDTEGP